MPTDNQRAELSLGTVNPCTADDRPALIDLYRAAYPNSSGFEAAADIQPSQMASWAVYRDSHGDVRVGMFAYANGIVWVLARPEDGDCFDVRRGLVMLATEIRKVLVSQGITDLTLVHSVHLERLATHLEREGFLSRGVAIARTIRFGESGDVERVI